jgi:hypothetical protein
MAADLRLLRGFGFVMASPLREQALDDGSVFVDPEGLESERLADLQSRPTREWTRTRECQGPGFAVTTGYTSPRSICCRGVFHLGRLQSGFSRAARPARPVAPSAATARAEPLASHRDLILSY